MELNHIIVWAENQKESAEFLAHILGVPETDKYAHFDVVQVQGVSFDFANLPFPGPVQRQHIAFLISEEQFDQVIKRIKDGNVPHWADPLREVPDVINNDDGGRGVYFAGPEGHNWEVMTRPYGRGAANRNRLFPADGE